MGQGLNSLYWGWSSPPLIGNPYSGYINSYYWVDDDHPLLYGNNGSFDESAHMGFSGLYHHRCSCHPQPPLQTKGQSPDLSCHPRCFLSFPHKVEQKKGWTSGFIGKMVGGPLGWYIYHLYSGYLLDNISLYPFLKGSLGVKQLGYHPKRTT